MTYRILKSAIAGIHDFEVQVAAHLTEMKNWRAHTARAKEDEANGVTGIDRHWPLKRPGANPLVEAAVNENDEADYEIINDDPTPDQVLRAKKDELLRDVTHLEHAAVAAVAPHGKQRLLAMREGDIRKVDVQRAAELRAKDSETMSAAMTRRNAALAKRAEAEREASDGDGILAKAGLKKKKVPEDVEVPEVPRPLTDEDIAAHIEKQRSADDTAHLQQQADRRDRIAAIERAAAQAHHDIEDLTAETIGAWRAPDFKS